MAWKPGQRRAQRALEDPFEDAPAHLRQPIWNWIADGFESLYGFDSARIQQIALDLRMHLPAGPGSHQMDVFLKGCNENPEFMLDLVEAMLERFGWDRGRASRLRELLAEGNSAYTVKQEWDGLEDRVAPGVRELIQEAVDASGGSAGHHLTNAWNAAYGRNADPVKAYSESIKAAEAALAARVSPQNGKQTLGTMIRDIAAKPSKWTFVIADGNVGGVDTVLRMMRMLWDGQTSRHGGVSPTRDETLDEARAALHLTAPLVQFGTSAAFDIV